MVQLYKYLEGDQMEEGAPTELTAVDRCLSPKLNLLFFLEVFSYDLLLWDFNKRTHV